jgi:hypothetical protein
MIIGEALALILFLVQLPAQAAVAVVVATEDQEVLAVEEVLKTVLLVVDQEQAVKEMMVEVHQEKIDGAVAVAVQEV